jgi:choline kinase
MKAIILAAGRGSRMDSLTESQPKCLVKIHQYSLIDLQIMALKRNGINEIALVTGYKRKLLKNYTLFEFFNQRWAETNMVSSLECADSWLKSSPCIISYSDIFYSHSAIDLLIKSKADIAITYDINWLKLWAQRFENPLDDAESFSFDTYNNITEIGKKVTKLSEIKGQYMGLLKITPSGWCEIKKIRKEINQYENDRLSMTSLLQIVANKKNIPIKAIPYGRYWGEVDTKNDLAIYNKMNIETFKSLLEND